MITLHLYGAVGGDVFAADLVRQLNDAAGQPVELHISSHGGDVQEGLALVAAIRAHGNVTCMIDGFACSIASAIAVAGVNTIMSADALFMVHNPSTSTWGTRQDHERSLGALDAVTSVLVDLYMRKTGATEQVVRAWMDAETWFTAAEALAAGFADSIAEAPPQPIAASIDLSKFNNVPPHARNRLMTATNQLDAGVQQERRRVAAITSSFGLHPGHDALMARCITDGTSAEEANARLLQAIASQQVAQPAAGLRRVEVVDRLPEFTAAASDALAARMGVRSAKTHPAAGDLARMRIVDVAATCLRLGGVSTAGWNDARILKAAFAPTQGTSHFPELLRDSLGKVLLQAYGNEPDSAAGWTLPVDVRDFKTQYRPNLSEFDDLPEVPEHAEYTLGQFTEHDAETYALATYGKVFNVSRQALINDDLQAFTRVPVAFGQAAMRKELDLIFGILTGNPTMADGVTLFHSTHGNLAASGTELSVESLGAARAAMRAQTGARGLQILNIVPRYLIVPAALETQAEQLIASLVDPAKTNDTTNLQFIRGLELRADARLDNTSTTAWYLAASPTQVGTIERAYLDGTGGVQIEETDLFTVDGISYKVRHDFATAPVDHRGLYKNAGA